jgi:glyoxylase I family protein
VRALIVFNGARVGCFSATSEVAFPGLELAQLFGSWQGRRRGRGHPRHIGRIRVESGARAVASAGSNDTTLEYAHVFPENQMFNRVHHIAIICSDYASSKHFYVEVLALKIVREVYREERRSFKLDLQMGKQYQRELFSFTNPPARPTSPEACGRRHIALEVGDAQDAARRVRERGIEVQPFASTSLLPSSSPFLDPDDLPIEIYER